MALFVRSQPSSLAKVFGENRAEGYKNFSFDFEANSIVVSNRDDDCIYEEVVTASEYGMPYGKDYTVRFCKVQETNNVQPIVCYILQF